MRLVIIGGGPAGNQAASTAARLGATVTLVERDILGGSAHLLDCIPSKAMVATGNALAGVRRARSLGLDVELGGSGVDLRRVGLRIAKIQEKLCDSVSGELASQGVCLVDGVGRLVGEKKVLLCHHDGLEEEVSADAVLLSAGSRPRMPDWVPFDGKRVLSSRHAYSLTELPEHIVIVGSGVTGVEFVHIFSSLGCKVTLVASRRHVLPGKDPEVAYALEENLVQREVDILKGARAQGVRWDEQQGRVCVEMVDGRIVTGSHVLMAIGSVPNTEELGLETEGVKTLRSGHIPIDELCQTNVAGIYACGDVTDKLPLSSLAAAQGRLVGYHVMGRRAPLIDYGSVAQAIFTDPEIADVGVAEAEAFSIGRKTRITKVPFSFNPKTLIEGYQSGFVKIISDPLTAQVLGGSVVGAHAAELVAPIALAVRTKLRVTDLVSTLNVHPSLSESLADAAE